MIETEIKAFGRVQGVNFRNTIKHYCDSKNIRGYAMNKENGSVQIIAQGEKEDIEALKAWIKSSPGFSKIKNMTFLEQDVRAKYEGFEVIREGNFFVDKVKSLSRLGKSLVIENKEKYPTHLAIIPDGNRRWAREKGLHASFGHYTAASTDHIVEIILQSKKIGIKYLSIWGFSTENWKRDKLEIDAIFDLIYKNIDKFYELAEKNQIRFKHVGRTDRIPSKLKDALQKLEYKTWDFDSLHVLLCLDYGGRDELIRAVNKAIKEGKKIEDEKDFYKYLDTAGMPDPDLIIRTSGEERTSGFMPFQAAYSELYFTKKYFPEFNAADLREAVEEYSRRTRRFGATAKSDLVSSK